MADNHRQTDNKTNQQDLQKRNNIVACVVVCVVAGMVGLSYAAVPLYQIFCQVTGYEGTTQRADVAPNTILNKKIRIRFDSNITGGLDWEFKPVEQSVDIKIGENKLAFYTAKNISDKPLTGEAKFKVMPEIVGGYFNKIECFCFTEQKLEPGQKIDMPVSFFIDPEIVNDPSANAIEEITLSYIFYPIKEKIKQSEAVDKTKESTIY